MTTAITIEERPTQARLPTDDEILIAYDQHPRYYVGKTSSMPRAISGFAYPDDNPVCYIKYVAERIGGVAEARTQEYAHGALEELPQEVRQGIRIPEVYRWFIRNGLVYIVMEYVPGKTMSKLIEELGRRPASHQEKLDRIADGLKVLLSLKVPDNATPGPFGGGHIRHALFSDYRAPIEYKSVGELQQHINNVATTLNLKKQTVRFIDDHGGCQLYFCFADLYEGNFMFPESGELYFVDFGHASFLPLDFMAYELENGRFVANQARKKLALPTTNLEAMQNACTWFVRSTSKIGLPLNKVDS